MANDRCFLWVVFLSSEQCKFAINITNAEENVTQKASITETRSEGTVFLQLIYQWNILNQAGL